MSVKTIQYRIQLTEHTREGVQRDCYQEGEDKQGTQNK